MPATQLARKCLEIDEIAVRLYRRLSAHSSHPDLAGFWERMSKEEEFHCRFWRRLLESHREEDLGGIFVRGEEMLAELEDNRVRAAEMLTGDTAPADIPSAFLAAYRMEFYLLHPAFGAFFRLGAEDPSLPDIERDYEAHVGAFIEQLTRHGSNDPAMGLAGEALQRLWTDNRRFARTIKQVQQLRGLLPICASCKKIRDDGGYWQQVEQFIGDRADVQFTHGICPDCRRKLYPEFDQAG